MHGPTLTVVTVLTGVAAAQPLTWLGGEPYAGDPYQYTRGTLTLPWIRDIPSIGALGDPANTVLMIDFNRELHVLVGEDVRVTGLAWECTIRTSESSALRDAAILFHAGTGVWNHGLVLTPAFDQDGSGVGSFGSGGFVDFGDAGLPDFTLPGGVLGFSFFEWMVDQPGLIEAHWDIRLGFALDYYPGPAPGGLAVLALAGVVAAKRRRGTEPA
jgi:hypothetical protein